MSRDKNPGILNLNAPLLSTRRPLFPFRQRLSTSSRPTISPPHPHPQPHQRIPFSWEHAPGQPKYVDSEADGSLDGHFTPRPRPPPGHYCRLPPTSLRDRDELRDDRGDHGSYYCCYDNPTSAPDSLSTSNVNAMADVFSLSEAIDVLEKAEDGRESDGNLSALKRLAESAGDTSPSFMINRFLPDANALAASSALRYYSRSWNSKTTRHRRHSSYSSGYTRDEAEEEEEARSSWNMKGCGMERVFQWRMKPRFCGESSTSPGAARSPSILGNRRKPSS